MVTQRYHGDGGEFGGKAGRPETNGMAQGEHGPETYFATAPASSILTGGHDALHR
jgi:hypothetical protein